MLLDYQNTSFEVAEAKPEMAILPVGATEPCGDHLPIGTTTFILDAVARGVAERLKGTVYLLPTMPLGTSGSHGGTPGTLALGWRTLMSVVYDLVESLVAQGIRRVAVINGLGGTDESTVRPRENTIIKTAVRQLNYDVPELDAIWVQPFTVAGPELRTILDSAGDDVHAGELATSLMLHLHPQAVKGAGIDYSPQDQVPGTFAGAGHLSGTGKDYLDYVPFRALCPAGVWGRPSLASAVKGELALEAAVRRTVEYIETSFAQLATMKRGIKRVRS